MPEASAGDERLDPVASVASVASVAPTQKEADVARRIRAQGRAAGLTIVEIANRVFEACSESFGTTRVKAHRLANGVALADVVEQIRAIYELEGKPVPRIGETSLSAYESGHKRPGPEYLHYLCAVYRADPHDLGFVGPCLCGQSHYEGDVRGTSLVGDNRGEAQAGEDDNVLRRTLLQLMAGSGVALDDRFFASVDGIRRRMEDTLVSASVSPSMLDQWEEVTNGYGHSYMNAAPLRLLCDVLLDFSDVRRMCDARQPIELQDRLCRLASRMAALAGMTLIDLGDQRLARSFFRTARTAADETGDRVLRAWVLAREALVPLYYGDPREAIQLAQRSRDLAGRLPSVPNAMAPIIEARAMAKLTRMGASGHITATQRSLELGRAVFSQLGPESMADTAFGYTERQLCFHEGNALVGIGDYKRAEASLDRALTLYSETERLDWALVQLDQATCKIESGEPAEGLRVAATVVTELPAEHCTDIVLRIARNIGNAVQAKHGDMIAVREYREALEAAKPRGLSVAQDEIPASRAGACHQRPRTWDLVTRSGRVDPRRLHLTVPSVVDLYLHCDTRIPENGNQARPGNGTSRFRARFGGTAGSLMI